MISQCSDDVILWYIHQIHLLTSATTCRHAPQGALKESLISLQKYSKMSAIKSSTWDVWGRHFSWPAILYDLPTHSHRLQFFVTLRHSVRYGNTLCTDAETIRSVFYVDTYSRKTRITLTRMLSKTTGVFDNYFKTNHNPYFK